MEKNDEQCSFRKIMENVRKRRYQAGSKKEMFGMSEIPQPNYHTTTSFSEYLLAVEIKKTHKFE